MSGLSLLAEVNRTDDCDRRLPFLTDAVEKSFSGGVRKFQRPLMRFARGDLRTHIDSYENDHRPSYWLQSTLPLQQCRKTTFARFSMSFDFRLFDSIDPSRKSSTPFAVTYEAATLPSGRAKLLSSG
jgi:hypothetical protein